MLTTTNTCKVVGWSKAVVYWDFDKKQFIPQKRENRHRGNNHLPQEAFNSRKYNAKYIDVWSIGVMICGLLTSKYPINIKENVKFTVQLQQFFMKYNIGQEEVVFLSKLMNEMPNKRATFEQVYSDEYLNTNAEQKKVFKHKEHKINHVRHHDVKRKKQQFGKYRKSLTEIKQQIAFDKDMKSDSKSESESISIPIEITKEITKDSSLIIHDSMLNTLFSLEDKQNKIDGTQHNANVGFVNWHDKYDDDEES